MKKKLSILFVLIFIVSFVIVNINLNNNNNKSSKKLSKLTLANLVALSDGTESNYVIKCGQFESAEYKMSDVTNGYYRTYTCIVPGEQNVAQCKVGKITYSRGVFGIRYNTEDNTTTYNCSDL
jgi:hypothetical protein